MYSKSKLILMGCAAGAAMLWIDMAYSAGKSEGRREQVFYDEASEPDPSPGEVEPEDSPSPTESDEG